MGDGDGGWGCGALGTRAASAIESSPASESGTTRSFCAALVHGAVGSNAATSASAAASTAADDERRSSATPGGGNVAPSPAAAESTVTASAAAFVAADSASEAARRSRTPAESASLSASSVHAAVHLHPTTRTYRQGRRPTTPPWTLQAIWPPPQPSALSLRVMISRFRVLEANFNLKLGILAKAAKPAGFSARLRQRCCSSKSCCDCSGFPTPRSIRPTRSADTRCAPGFAGCT